jgi:hypothetical protein
VKLRGTALDLLLRLSRVPFVGVHHVFASVWASLHGGSPPPPLHLTYALLLLCKLAQAHGVTLTRVSEAVGGGGLPLDAVPLVDVLTLAVTGLENRDKSIRKASLNVRLGGGGVGAVWACVRMCMSPWVCLCACLDVTTCERAPVCPCALVLVQLYYVATTCAATCSGEERLIAAGQVCTPGLRFPLRTAPPASVWGWGVGGRGDTGGGVG